MNATDGLRPVSGNVLRVGRVLTVAFAVLAVGAGYWQVIRAPEFDRAPDNPAVIAAGRSVARGIIRDRDGTVLVTNARDVNGDPYRKYADRSLSTVLGYVSRQYGTAGLERAYSAELTGAVSTDPLGGLFGGSGASTVRPDDLSLALSLPLQRAAVKALGASRGAVVMLDPATGEILALASTPTFDASAIANPATAAGAWGQVSTDPATPLLDRATLGQYVPGSVFKIVTSIAALATGAIGPATSYPQQPGAERDGLLVSGYRVRDGHHPFTGSGTAAPLRFDEAIEVSCNIYFALTGLAVGGERLAESAASLGFGAPLPFDLPTAGSQVTNGGGSFGGGFSDDVELANAAYGQAQTLVTPLQMALVAGAVANGGVLMKPHLVTGISGPDGTRTVAPEAWRRVISNEGAQTIAAAMERAVEGRWGRLFTPGAAVPGIPTAGKSGTAELEGTLQPHSWFIGFAPVDHPRVAIAVLVEGSGSGGQRASPIAGSLLRLFFATVGR